MSILAPVADEQFMFRIHKSLETNPALGWVNTYEYVATTGAEYGDLVNLALQLTAMEVAIHQEDVLFQKYVISTWVPDGVPYDPTSFVSSSLVGVAGTNAATPGLSLHNCLQVNRQVPTGRQGKLFYRRVLSEGDVSSPAGDPVALTASLIGLRGLIEDVTTGLGMNAFFTGPDSLVGYLAMIGTGGATRPISAFDPVAAKVVPYNHRYFDRA